MKPTESREPKQAAPADRELRIRFPGVHRAGANAQRYIDGFERAMAGFVREPSADGAVVVEAARAVALRLIALAEEFQRVADDFPKIAREHYGHQSEPGPEGGA